MNRKALWIVLLTLGLTYVAGCGGSSHNINNIQVTISQPPPGFLQPDAAAVPVTATVTRDSANAGVTWSCSPGNSLATCGSFNPATTPSGTATMYQPPPTAVGAVTITATSVTNSAAFANANVQISTSGGIAGNFSFYVSGLDADNVYALAGAITISSNGTITAGEEDYNNASNVNVLDDTITSGVLSFDPNLGLGTLTLNATKLGTEVFALNFVNNSHALIVEADGLATSSGSMDLQTLPSTPAGGFSFTLAGTHSSGEMFVYGGVFSLSGTSLTNGIMDANDGHGGITTNQDFTGTLMAADTSGRGTGTLTHTIGGLSSSIVYYVVGPEVIRIIDMDKTDNAIGSAFSQGASAGNFTNASIGNSVFSIQSNFAGNLFASVGQVFPSGADAVGAKAVRPEAAVTNNFTGVADVNEELVGFADAQPISGTYSVAANGYGSLTILPAGTLGDVSVLGIYATDPNLNLNDPNNTSGGGGALVSDLDLNLAGTGVLVPQTDNSTASFAGNYALGFQDFINTVTQSGELDFVGNATATATAPTLLTGNGTVSDPFDLLGGATFSLSASFTSPIVPDTANLGRYTISPFSVTVDSVTTPIPYLGIVYQASGGQLFLMEDGADQQGSVFNGQIQQQQSLPLGGEAKKAAAKSAQKH
jgi:hypothetical protein